MQSQCRSNLTGYTCSNMLFQYYQYKQSFLCYRFQWKELEDSIFQVIAFGSQLRQRIMNQGFSVGNNLLYYI